MPTIAKRPGELLWFALLGAGMIAGAAAVVTVLIKGHGEVYNLTREIPWGILIATYVFFVVSSTGLCLVSSLGDVWGFEKFTVIGRRGHLVAILTLLTGFGTIAMELNHPLRLALYAIISPNFQSPIWWMGTLYGFYMCCLIVEFTSLMRGWTRTAFISGLAGFFAAITAHSNLGAVFGLLEARHFWYGSFLPIYFIVSALASGAALTALIVYFNHKARHIDLSPQYKEFMYTMGKLQALFLGILLFFVIWKLIPGLYGQPPEKYEATMALLTGPLAFNFWFFEMALGILIPLAIVANRRTRTVFGVMLASLLSTIGIFFMRYDLVIAGQMVPMREAEGSPSLLSYVPSVAEIAIVVGALATCLFLYTMAEKFFDLEGGHRH
ncbi:Hdr-like menaquinol oxidoreductase integral membrane subunit HmeB [Desulfuromonas carbonis]|uniref:NrfD/PsrC family molybdoenzyme membrane anchor subunit n=1 Tax=Desulfuromonas sp. DDH964 TaxID=1823759 RepID=UPI00078D8C30|nr:NrfD/PsrC family molybdoenzyme membrane anchor subunit [Desulfuromonas sp. DDH964]AMV71218.1 periplasmically oriented, membrane-bound formate dehydrogenase, b-type cytochrome subunit [Desulfuromonas sp. DDH964]